MRGMSAGARARLQTAAARARPLGKRLGRGWQQEVGLVVAIVLIGVYFASRNGVFLSLENLGNVAERDRPPTFWEVSKLFRPFRTRRTW